MWPGLVSEQLALGRRTSGRDKGCRSGKSSLSLATGPLSAAAVGQERGQRVCGDRWAWGCGVGQGSQAEGHLAAAGAGLHLTPQDETHIWGPGGLSLHLSPGCEGHRSCAHCGPRGEEGLEDEG